jgi:DNA-binding NarL/FixJ family response regulator
MQRQSKLSTEKSKVKTLSATSILVIESQEIEARGVKSALISRGCTSVYYCFSHIEAIAAIKESAYDVVLLGGKFDGRNELSLIPEIRALAPTSVIAIFAVETPWILAQEVQESGANALLSKSIPFPVLCDALEDLMRHPERFIFIGDRVLGKRMNELTLSEREVLTQLSEGFTTREIAQNRHNSEATIKSHLTSIYRKLGVRNRVEAIAHLYQ